MKEEVATIYDWGTRIKRLLLNLQEDKEISDINRELILLNDKKVRAQGLSDARRCKYLWILPRLAKLLKKDLDKVSREDLEDAFNALRDSGTHGEQSIADYQRVAKAFARRSLGNGEELPVPYRFKVKKPEIDLKAEDLLTPEEAMTLIDCARSIRDKALIATALNGCLRVEELATLKIGSIIERKQNIWVLRLQKSKTKKRLIWITWAIPFLQQWVRFHPQKDNPNAWLWSKNPKYLFGYWSISKIFKIAKEKACEKMPSLKTKPLSMKWLRKAQLTWYVKKGVGAQQLAAIAGWSSPRSEAVEHYIRLGEEDVRLAILQAEGLTEVKYKPVFEVKKCFGCESVLEPSAVACNVCRLPIVPDQSSMLSTQQALERKEKREIVNLILSDVDPEKPLMQQIDALVERRLKERLSLPT